MRRLFARRDPVPQPVRDAVPGRVLASAEVAGGAWLVGTRDALAVVAPTGEAQLLPWERVQRADWDADASTLTVERVEEFGTPVVPMVFEVAAPGPFLQLLRERVSASIVVQKRVVLGRKRGLTVIGRRPPSGWSAPPNSPGCSTTYAAATPTTSAAGAARSASR